MNVFRKSALMLALILLLPMCLFVERSNAAEANQMVGWEKGSPYNQHYKADELDQFKGTVVDIKEITPMPGMSPGVGLVVRDQDRDLTEVQLGPKAYVNIDKIGLKKGDKAKFKGSWSEINGKSIFMASKVKKGDNEELKIRRTKDGTPYWTMSQEELAKEKEEK